MNNEPLTRCYHCGTRVNDLAIQLADREPAEWTPKERAEYEEIIATDPEWDGCPNRCGSGPGFTEAAWLRFIGSRRLVVHALHDRYSFAMYAAQHPQEARAALDTTDLRGAILGDLTPTDIVASAAKAGGTLTLAEAEAAFARI